MTRDQASTQNLVNSVRDFMLPNIITPYTTEVTGKPYAGEPVVVLDEPDDTAVHQGAPTIVIELPVDLKAPLPIGIGDGEVWRQKLFHLSVFPAMNQDGVDAGKPSIQSAAILHKYFDYALGTALVIPINDYSTTPTTTAVDYAYVEDQRLIKPRGAYSKTLALTRHRFDYSFVLKYAVTTIN
jgi:hypothetical protein